MEVHHRCLTYLLTIDGTYLLLHHGFGLWHRRGTFSGSGEVWVLQRIGRLLGPGSYVYELVVSVGSV